MSTFTKVIVGDDGKAGGTDALALARTLAPSAEILLASSFPWDPGPSRFTQAGYGALLRTDTERRLTERVKDADLPETTRTAAIADSSAGRGLHRLAESEGADLIVIGSSHRGAVSRLLLGDVGRAVLNGAPCPVAVAPRDYAAPGAPKRIGVAFDHSPEAAHALDVALDLARDVGATVTIRQVVAADLLPAVAGVPLIHMDEISDELRNDAQRRLDEVVAGLPDQDGDGDGDGAAVPVTAQAVLGLTAERLEDLAHEVEMVVTGSRGYGALRRVVLGSTADRLIHRATCPVLVVPRGATEGMVAECPPPASSSISG